jgi:hypothetical protein
MTEPTKPPPPPIANLPFQVSGSSNSKWVSAPITPETLQCGTGAASSVTDVSRTSGRPRSDSRLQLERSATATASSDGPSCFAPQAPNINAAIATKYVTIERLKDISYSSSFYYGSESWIGSMVNGSAYCVLST